MNLISSGSQVFVFVDTLSLAQFLLKSGTTSMWGGGVADEAPAPPHAFEIGIGP